MLSFFFIFIAFHRVHCTDIEICVYLISICEVNTHKKLGNARTFNVYTSIKEMRNSHCNGEYLLLSCILN